MMRPNRNEYIKSADMLLLVDRMRGIDAEDSSAALLTTAADTAIKHMGVRETVNFLHYLTQKIERGAE